MEHEVILELRHVSKLYPGVTALDDVSVSFRRGEVHALVGENGAGKSTLIKIIAGVTEPTRGDIAIEGRRFDCLTPTAAKNMGVSVVYQEFTLVPVLTAAENIFLGEYLTKAGLLDKGRMNRQTQGLFDKLGIKLDPRVLVGDLTTGYQQLCEIAKAVSRSVKILILDEPSAPLTNMEVESLFQIVRALKAEGVTVIYISHRLEEIFYIADRVTVLRDGRHIVTKDVADTDKDELIQYMVGRKLTETYPPHNFAQDEVVLSARNLCGNGIRDISFDLRKGEILGFGGLVGAGRTELMQLIFGNARLECGTIWMAGKQVRLKTPRHAVSQGLSLIPEDRKSQGLILEMSIKQNTTLSILKTLVTKLGFISRRAEKRVTQKAVEDLSIKTPSINQRCKNLSGGNQQKVIIGKWLSTSSNILIMDEPTRGIDVGTKHEIYQIMAELTRQGKSIIMISSDMEEIIGMSDRMIVLCKGRVSAELERSEFSQELILKKAAGE